MKQIVLRLVLIWILILLILILRLRLLLLFVLLLLNHSQRKLSNHLFDTLFPCLCRLLCFAQVILDYPLPLQFHFCKQFLRLLFLFLKYFLIVKCKPNFFKSYIYHSFMSLQKKDFIEIEFTGKTKDGEIFDSNIKKDIEKAGLKLEAKPFIFALGEGMFLSGVDEYLIGKDIGEHKIELESKKAFGLRDSKQLQMIPIKVFKQHNLMPYAGAVFNFDNRIAKVLTVSGGRVMVDFNHLLAGKDVIYTVKIFRKIEDLNEKLKHLMIFYLNRI